MDSVVPWRVRTFGGFSVERAGVRIERFRTQHAAALLAFLALRPDVRHSRELLAELLWPEAEPLVARQRLSTALANLRRELEASGPPVFTGGRESVGTEPGMLTSDAAEFNRIVRQARGASRERRRELLREAADLAERGGFLPGFYFEWTVEQSGLFEEALDAVRAELEAEPEAPRLAAEDPSSLMGRASEIEALDRLILDRPRCISILGAGGVGKTRLALDLFERHARRFSGASRFIRLAEVRHPAEFLPAVAQALHLPLEDPESLPSAIAGALSVPGLIVLDNLEHLLPGIHGHLDVLVRSCGNSLFVCTSRRRLGVAGEQVLRVRPLRLPPMRASQGDLAEAPAIQLFHSRYREAGGAALPSEILPAVEEICRALGGLPLAIQLAASASVAVGVEALRQDAMLYRLLPTRNPDATNPHASLGEMIEWSLTLVDPATRRVLDRLCVLPGAFGFAMIRDLYGEDAATTLPRLHSDSLIEADGQGAMRVLEPIREHVRAQMSAELRRDLETGLVQRCAELAMDLEKRLEGPNQRAATEEAAAVWPTMRLAIQLAREHRLPSEGLRIGTGLTRHLILNFATHDAIAYLEGFLDMEGIDPSALAYALAMLARHTRNLGRTEAAYAYGERGLALAREIGDRRTEARCLAGRAYVACIREDQNEAMKLAQEALDLGSAIRDWESAAMGQMVMGHTHALFRHAASEEEAARTLALTEAHMEAAIAITRAAPDEFMETVVQYHRSAYSASDLDLFYARLSRAIEIARKNGWKLREAMVRADLVRRLYNAGHQGIDVLDELRSLQAVYADCLHWDARAERVAVEAEVLFRMNRCEEARSAMDEALPVLRRHGRPIVIEYHIQGLIYLALGAPEAEAPLLTLVEQSGRDEFSGMIGELARALLEARRGEDTQAYRRLKRFKSDSAPTGIQHAYADTWVALADLVAPRHRQMAIEAYRRSRPLYRAIKSVVDLRRVRMRVSSLPR